MKIKNTREKIIDTMYDLLADKGYDKASIGQIANIIGIKKASVYYYFRYKEDILIELVKKLYSLDYIVVKPKDVTNKKESYKNYLLDFGYSYIEFYVNNTKARRVYAEIDIQTARIPKLKKYVNHYNEDIKTKIKEILEYGYSINIFKDNLEIQESVDFIFTLLIGIDDILLYSYSVDVKKVWEIAISSIIK